MTTIPVRPGRFAARTDADFVERFIRWADAERTERVSLAGWSFRFAVRASSTSDVVLEATTANSRCVVIDPGGADELLEVRVDKAVLLAALPAGAKRFDGFYALQAAGPDGEDEVWSAGAFVLERGI